MTRDEKLIRVGVVRYRVTTARINGFIPSLFAHGDADADYIKHGATVDGKLVLEWKCATCGKKYQHNSTTYMIAHVRSHGRTWKHQEETNGREHPDTQVAHRASD